MHRVSAVSMGSIHRAMIPPPGAWRASELGGKQALILETPSGVMHALAVLIGRLRAVPLPQITRAQAGDPLIDPWMAQVRKEVMHGRGVAIVRGPDPERYALEDYARLYWALGTHLGRGVIQSHLGDYVARVERNPELPWRGTTTDMELRPHTDFHEVMSLASIRAAASGGLSGFVSSLAVHNEILRRRPELLEPLYTGWYNVSPLERHVSEQKTPIFSCVDGAVSCFYNRVFFARPGEAPEPFPEQLAEAMSWLDSVLLQEDLLLRFMLEPGEIVFWNNFLVMHSRTAFADTDAARRLLLRLWLHAPEGRPLEPGVRERGFIVDADHARGTPVPYGEGRLLSVSDLR